MTYDPRFFAGVKLFNGVPTDGLAAVCASAQITQFETGTLVFEQGGNAKHAFALAEGSVRIVQTGGDGGQAIIRFIAPGELFGTVPLFTNHRFPADAVAAEPSVVVSWSEHSVFALIQQYPRIAINVIRILGARLTEAQDRVRELSTQCAQSRLAHTILRLAAQAGHDVNGAVTINMPLRRKDLAEASGITLYTASRILAGWQKAGLLASHDQRVIIYDLQEINRLAAD